MIQFIAKIISPYIKFGFSYLLLGFAVFFCASCAAKLGDDKVLKAMIDGKKFIDEQNYDLAKKRLLFATEEINKVWGDTEEAQRARSLWYDESAKSFKGEPYERSMAFYYLGLLFLLEKDYGNAQASFRQSILQDAFAEEEQNRADLSIAYYLQALSLNYLGSKQNAKRTLEEFQNLKTDFPISEESAFGNVLLIIETGKSPKKIARGKDSEILFYKPGIDRVSSIEITLNKEEPLPIAKVEDVFWQASTRGGRPIDGIIEGKVFFKKTTNIVARISAEAFRFRSYSGKSDETQALLAAAAITAGVLSTLTKTKVDTRYWNNLPNAIYLQNLSLPTGDYAFNISFKNSNNTSIANFVHTQSIKEESLNVIRLIYL